MIISASRRTDIPAHYSKWFLNRLEEGFVLVRNPINKHTISRVSLKRSDVEGIVFWTKNPSPMIKNLSRLKNYPYYFQFTLNPYGKDIESNIPDKEKHIIPAFISLSEAIGKERVMWRYDPIILTDKHTTNWHIASFKNLTNILKKHTTQCTISFIDYYRSITSKWRELGFKEISLDDMYTLAFEFSAIAKKAGIKLVTCAESEDLSMYGITHGKCVDYDVFSKITGIDYSSKKDKNQRDACGCDESFDIGAYNSCTHLCRYCYANRNEKETDENHASHDAKSPLLLGAVGENDIIKKSKPKPVTQRQMKFSLE